jgi:1,4-alpha-glucan branching enzyme
MPGDDWQRFANLRLLLGYQYTQPGKKLLFMGGEFGQWEEWHHDQSLDWHLLEYAPHQGIQRWVRELNAFYRGHRALHEKDFTPDGFEWIDFKDADNSIISYLRKGSSPDDLVLVVCNFIPVPRQNYRVGVPTGGFWKEVLNSDAKEYGGSGWGNLGGNQAAPVPAHGKSSSLSLTIPPLSILIFKKE